jgi:hypothetical protein
MVTAFDFVTFKNDIENASNEFIANFTQDVLDPSLCEPENSPKCMKTLEDHRASLESFQGMVDMSLRKMDATICEQNIAGPVTPECPLNDLDVSVVRTTSDGRRLDRENVPGLEENVLFPISQVNERGKFCFFLVALYKQIGAKL